MLGLFIIAIIVIIYFTESMRRGAVESLISPIWVFTFFYVLSYPLRYYLIVEYEIVIIAKTKPTNDLLLLSLYLSFIAWLFVYIIYKFIEVKPKNLMEEPAELNSTIVKYRVPEGYPRGFYVLFLFVLMSGYLFYQDLAQNGYLLSKLLSGREHHLARFGNGPLYFLYSFYFDVFLIWLFFFKGARSTKKTAIILFVCLMIAFLESILFGTRRPLWLVLLAFTLAAVAIPNPLIFSKSLYKKILFSLILAPVLVAPFTTVLKYNFTDALESGIFFSDSIITIVTHVSSTFEGVDHLANYLGRVTGLQLLFGVDHGLAFLFNIGLAYIPRAIWTSKPELYGITETQAFLYPDMFVNSVSQTTIPPGLFVDFLYPFGLFSFLILLLLFAILLNWINKNLIIRSTDSSGFHLLTAAFLYIEMFNIVRGGTAIIKSLFLLIVVTSFFYLLQKIRWQK